MGMKSVQMSRKVHEVPRSMTMGGHPGGKAGHTGLDNGQQSPKAPPKTRPFATYPVTGAPLAAEQDGHREGPARSHQARKSPK